LKQPLAQIQITITESGISGVEVQADTAQQTKRAYTLLTYLAEELHTLDALIQSKNFRQRLTEVQEFVSQEQQERAENLVVQLLKHEVMYEGR
jgi:hypothetical protein